MAADARLKNEFTEDEKYHNIMKWRLEFTLTGLVSDVGINRWMFVVPAFQCWPCCWVHISVLNLDLYASCFDALMKLRGPNNLFVYYMYELRNLGRGLCTRKIGLGTDPSNPVNYYWPFQLWCGASVVVYSKCQCSSTVCLSLTFCSFYLGQPGGNLLGKSYFLDLTLVLFFFFFGLFLFSFFMLS